MLEDGRQKLITSVIRLKTHGGNLALSEIDKIRKFLADNQMDFISDIVPSDKERGVVVFVPLSRVDVRSSKVKGVVGKRKLGKVVGEIRDTFGVEVDLVYVGDISNALEAGLKVALAQNLPDLVADCFIALRSSRVADVWVQPTSENLMRPPALDKIVGDNLLSARIKANDVYWGLDKRRAPSGLAILKLIKVHAPVSMETLRHDLLASGFDVPNIRWLGAALDKLRKSGFTRRLSTAKYILTLQGLALVPHGRSRGSSDVERILVLGRRKWLE